MHSAQQPIPDGPIEAADGAQRSRRRPAIPRRIRSDQGRPPPVSPPPARILAQPHLHPPYRAQPRGIAAGHADQGLDPAQLARHGARQKHRTPGRAARARRPGDFVHQQRQEAVQLTQPIGGRATRGQSRQLRRRPHRRSMPNHEIAPRDQGRMGARKGHSPRATGTGCRCTHPTSGLVLIGGHKPMLRKISGSATSLSRRRLRQNADDAPTIPIGRRSVHGKPPGAVRPSRNRPTPETPFLRAPRFRRSGTRAPVV